jgi:hypothetical protein
VNILLRDGHIETVSTLSLIIVRCACILVCALSTAHATPEIGSPRRRSMTRPADPVGPTRTCLNNVAFVSTSRSYHVQPADSEFSSTSSRTFKLSVGGGPRPLAHMSQRITRLQLDFCPPSERKLPRGLVEISPVLVVYILLITVNVLFTMC